MTKLKEAQKRLEKLLQKQTQNSPPKKPDKTSIPKKNSEKASSLVSQPKPIFLGKSEKKVARQGRQNAKFRVTNSSMPKSLKITHPVRGVWTTEKDRYWPIHISGQIDDSFICHIGWPNTLPPIGPFLEEDTANFTFEFDNEIVVESEDGRPKPESFAKLEALDDPKWPLAVESFLIVDRNSEKQKMERGQNIVDDLLPNLQDLKFLDFGCGEGHVVKVAQEKAKLAVGYDPALDISEDWFVRSIERVKSLGPFDVIILYDVLDHVLNPLETMQQVVDCTHKDTRVVIRVHPWTSRHGGHLYQEKNKAYLHLVFKKEELNEIGLNPASFTKMDYESIFNTVGLKVKQKDEIVDMPENFFLENPVLKKRLLSFGDKNEIAISFLDFILGC